MTEKELNRLEVLAKAATSGPWARHRDPTVYAVYHPEFECWIPQDGHDADFIAAANPNTILSLVSLARVGLAAEKLSQYAEHDDDCVLPKWSAGRPTDDGGYEMRFAGVWYKARPVDESPPCECGLAEILSSLPKPGGDT